MEPPKNKVDVVVFVVILKAGWKGSCERELIFSPYSHSKIYQEEAAEFLPILLGLLPRNQTTSNDPLHKGERITSELENLNQESPYCWPFPMTSATSLSLLLSFRQTSPYSASNDGPADKQTCTVGHKQGLININTNSLSDKGYK